MEASRRCHNHEFLLSKATGRYRQLNSSYRVAPNHYKFMENRYGGMKVSNDLLTLGLAKLLPLHYWRYLCSQPSRCTKVCPFRMCIFLSETDEIRLQRHSNKGP